MKKLLLALAIVGMICGNAPAAFTIFDDFNVDEGHFNLDPNFSSTSVDDHPDSTADRVTTDGPLEGAGHQRLNLIYQDNSVPVAGMRIRHLSGGGTVANNISFTTSAGTDGFIGFYVKTTVSGLTTSINLDGPGGTTAEMDGSTSIALIADGNWHLYEWNLDSTTDWGAVTGIGGGHGGALQNVSHTIDSIYFRDANGTTGPDGTGIYYLDFVARNDSGSVGDFFIPAPIPEASSVVAFGLSAIFAVGAVWMGRRFGFKPLSV
jgi:hypothetical protein